MGGVGAGDRLGSPPALTDGLEVSVGEQRLRLIRGGDVVRCYRCSTAARGSGSANGSNRTPIGLHEVAEKIGHGMPPGAVFEGRAWTGGVWSPGDPIRERDLILTRILWLSGLEPGRNRGGDVDTRGRYIYIHGTNHEDRLGEPSSAGCVRLTNADVLDLFEMVSVGERVLIAGR